MSKIIMGLDASSSTIGLSIIEEQDDGYLVFKHVEHYKPIKKDTHILDTLKWVKEYILSKLKEFSPDYVVIEEYIKFMKGQSSADSTISLAVLNRQVCMTVYEFTEKKPIILNVNTIRAAIKPKNYHLPRVPKEEVLNVVCSALQIDWAWLKNKNGKILDENFDRSDSIACSYSFALLNRAGKIKANNGMKIKKIKKKTVDKKTKAPKKTK
jgi:Holliday junction resolvasome RuvABC endonuclease subunit